MLFKRFLSFILLTGLLLSLGSCSKNPIFDGTMEPQSHKDSDEKIWPTGTVTVICPWAVGGLADKVNRTMAEFGLSTFGQKLVADNITGKDGSIALSHYLNEPANSNTLILADEGSFTNLFDNPTPEYNEEDFIPVINIYSSTFVLFAHPSTNIKNYHDLKQFARKKEIEIATQGETSSEALQGVAFFNAIGSRAKIIPFEGSKRALSAVLSGEVPFAIVHASLARFHVKDEQLNPVIAFDDKKYIDEYYNLECVADYGHDTWMTNICSIFIRKGSDDEVIRKVYKDFKTILDDKDFLSKAEKLGVKIDVKDGKEVADYLLACKEKTNRYMELLRKNR